MTLVGDKHGFALGFEFGENPDVADSSVNRESWGRLQIWVAGRNLTAGLTADGTVLDAVSCPLLPLVDWFVGNWDSLFHEERFPRGSRAPSAAAWRTASLDWLPVDDDRLFELMEDREAWWRRHGLGSALPDCRVPDLHIRRFGNRIEISWTGREWSTVPGGIRLLENPGCAFFDLGVATQVVFDWCRAVAVELATRPALADHTNEVLGELDNLRSPDRVMRRLEIGAGLDFRATFGRLRAIVGLQEDQQQGVLATLLGLSDLAEEPRLWAPFSAPVLLYRSSAPSLSPSDIEALREACADAAGGAAGRVAELRDPAVCPLLPDDITADGNDRAMRLRELLEIDASEPLTGDWDLEREVLTRLAVRLREVRLDDGLIDGASIGGEGYQPTILVNLGGRFARTAWGRRMTIAHELCHLLHDGEEHGPAAIVSNPWSPYPLERRANAFAATLLAPEPAVRRFLPGDPSDWDDAAVRDAMRCLGVGASTLTWRLYQFRRISKSEQRAWLDRLSSFGGS